MHPLYTILTIHIIALKEKKKSILFLNFIPITAALFVAQKQLNMGWKRGGKNNYHAPKTCRAPHPSMIEKGGVNEQTSLTVVINVHLPVFLMGNLIKNLLVASGLLSHPITAPPCQNLCHRPFRSSPHSNHLPRVSYDICVSGSCDGMLLACYSSAGAPCWLLSTMQPHWCCVLWPATGWRIKKKGGGGMGWVQSSRDSV